MRTDLSFSDELAAILYKRWAEQPLQDSEQRILNEWLAASPGNSKILSEIMNDDWLMENLKGWKRGNAEAIWKKSKAPVSVAGVRKMNYLRSRWLRYAAAILLVVTVVVIYYSVFYTAETRGKVVQAVPPSSEQDIFPGSDRAVLTLSDGRKVELNNATSETIHDGTLSIKNSNGQLTYGNPGGGGMPASGGNGATGSGGGPGEARTGAYNTMTTPRGGQYKLTLSDGTKVWLNAASSITYPAAFTGKSREVSVAGEAYFEVARNKEKPFIVNTRTDEITVLGTSFNVNAYADEIPKTSLMEGSVRISSAGGIILQPGQAYTNGKITTTNIQQDIAWKNGVFDFNQLELRDVMRQLARWYDVDVRYEGSIPRIKYYGEAQRKLSLGDVLEVLSGMGAEFKIKDNKTLVVTSSK